MPNLKFKLELYVIAHGTKKPELNPDDESYLFCFSQELPYGAISIANRSTTGSTVQKRVSVLKPPGKVGYL